MNKLGAISGTLWGLLGTFLGLATIGKPAIVGLVAGPLIGMLIIRIVPFWAKRNTLSRILLAYGSLILAAALFGLIVGIADMIFGVPGRLPWAVVIQAISICAGGILLSNFWLGGIAFWPLAYYSFMALHKRLESGLQ